MKTNNVTILRELSSTQRLSLKTSQKSVVIQKEYRKDSSADWIISKGIEIPNTVIPTLVQQLGNV